MPGAGSYVAGVAILAAVLGACGFCAWTIVARRLPHLRGAARGLALALVGYAALLAVHLIPAALGILSRATVLIACFVAALCVLRVPRTTDAVRDQESAFRFPLSAFSSWWLAAAAWAAVVGWLVTWERSVVTNAVTSVDALSFHLPDVASWIQTGSIWQNDQFEPLFAAGNYPQNGDVLFLAVMQPFDQDAFVRVALLPFLGLVALAVYALARELGALRSTSALAGAAAVATPVVLTPAASAVIPDAVMLFAFGAGVVFLVRHARTGLTSDLVLAGLGLGLAFGAKWYGVSSVLAVVAVWAVARLVAGRPVLRDGWILVGSIAAAGGIWLVRNLALVGNPVFPVDLPGFTSPDDVIRREFGWNVLHYMVKPSAWGDFVLPAWWDAFALAGPLALIGVAGAAALAWRGRPPSRGRVLALSACVVLLFFVYSITPYTALGPDGLPLLIRQNARYLAPGVLIALALVAWAAGRLPRLRAVVEALLAVAVVVGLAKTTPGPESAAKVAGVGAALFAVGLAAAALAPRVRLTPVRAVAAAAVVVAVLAVGGRALQTRHADKRYAGEGPALDWVARNAAGRQRIALAGTWDERGLAPVYPLFGPRLDNRVSYLGRFVRGMLNEYDAPSGFQAALGRGGYDVLVLGRSPNALGERRDVEGWARGAGWRVVARDARLTVMTPPP